MDSSKTETVSELIAPSRSKLYVLSEESLAQVNAWQGLLMDDSNAPSNEADQRFRTARRS